MGLCELYTSELDFRNETIDDSVHFILYVRSETFISYAEKIAASCFEDVLFTVKQVYGFYSYFSPHPPHSYRSLIKVLIRSDYDVEIPNECDFVPLRLGKLNYANLIFRRSEKLKNVEDIVSDKMNEWIVNDNAIDERSNASINIQLIYQLK